uniref:GIR1-like zinc ribbon domain-containing protein n=1 Tax=Kalanchoe fedtschenkoi TaxID=63787 RepID=A0A7N0SWT5_KALFE
MGTGSSLNLDLMLHLSPPSQGYYGDGEPAVAAGSMSSSSAATDGSLCIYSPESSHTSGSKTRQVGMVLAGCQRCLMYFMLSELDLKCPKCKSNSLLMCFTNRNK